MRFRIAQIKDLDRILELQLLNAKYHADMVSGGALKVHTRTFFENLTKKRIENPGTKVCLAIENDRIIGYAIGCLNEQHPIFDLGKEGLIDDLYVDVNFRRLGYANLLVKELMNWFCENEVEQVVLNVYASNIKGDAFWTKQGFGIQFKRMIKQL